MKISGMYSQNQLSGKVLAQSTFSLTFCIYNTVKKNVQVKFEALQEPHHSKKDLSVFIQ